jgi:hypothetical protein
MAVYNWTGIYIGANAGYATGQQNPLGLFSSDFEIRERDGIPLGLMIQVDTLCHKIPNFIEKAKRAGVSKGLGD